MPSKRCLTRAARVLLQPPVFNRRRACCALLTTLLAAGLPALAQEDQHSDEAAHSILVDEQLDLATVLEHVLEHDPRAATTAALGNRANAESGFADSWFPDSVSLNGYHMTDRPLDDFGSYENQVALSLPLWRLGEKRAQTAFGDGLQAESATARRELRWQASGTLRRSLWDLEAARRQWQLGREQQQLLFELLDQVRIQVEAGELSRADELATLQELGAWQSETLDLEAGYQDAVRFYRAITGLGAMPAGFAETLSERQDIGDQHPALNRAHDRLANAEAAVEVARQQVGARPSLDVYWRDNQGDEFAPQISSLGIGLTVPLGKSPQHASVVAKAEQDAAEARAQLAETRRQLELDLHEARHQLHVTGEQLEIAESLLEAGQERNRMDRTEFDLGEISMTEWLRRLAAFKNIQQNHALLLTRQQAAIAAYNQAVGESL